ncbi:MAG: Nif3-like dinuclear metal center hexameric protein [Bacteroidota bacterium]
MIASEIIKLLEDWSPPGAAWERDNVGLQVGSRELKVSGVFLCLELNEKVLQQAIQKKCNFIFTHHPLIFNPLKKIDTSRDQKAVLIEKIIKNNITVYSAHTNLDSTKGGVSFELAKTLKLKNIKFLELQSSNQYKVVVFAPEDYLEKLSGEVFSSGGGVIGEYDSCSFRLNGIGTFRGSEKANPSVGKKLKLEKVNEVRLEFIVDSWNLNKVLNAIIKTHPYEEPAFDVYPLKNRNVNYGAGAIGELEKELNTQNFLGHVKKSLKADALKYCSGKKNKIKRVAVCGGSGSELIESAIGNGADAFVTADIKYHAFQDAENKILLIDAGHYETEIFSLNAVYTKLKDFISAKENIKILKYTDTTNPVKFYKH